MNKTELIKNIADKTGMSLPKAKVFVEQLLSHITQRLQQGKNVRFTGFGTFSIVHKRSRLWRNPRTAKRLFLPSHRYPKFKPAKKLRKKALYL